MDKLINELVLKLNALDTETKISALNHIKLRLHEISPFKDNPVDCVTWVKQESVHSNSYNPNSISSPEMKLLETSILEDGYTQPIVAWEDSPSSLEVVDGFHRNKIGKESKVINKRVLGYLPVVLIRSTQKDISDRMASTIRHNKARGKHQITSMSDIVVELKRKNWSNKKISTHLGMDQDEILRLSQISGLIEMFSDSEYSNSWEIESSRGEDDIS